jgi:hypothetical protein
VLRLELIYDDGPCFAESTEACGFQEEVVAEV